jgi:hypothetical protein
MTGIQFEARAEYSSHFCGIQAGSGAHQISHPICAMELFPQRKVVVVGGEADLSPLSTAEVKNGEAITLPLPLLLIC